MNKSNDTHFITNEDGYTMEKRIKTILEHDTEKFDVIVGYFYLSGFSRIYKELENVSEIRILVGISVDADTQRLLFETGISKDDARRAISKKIEDEWKNTRESREIIEGFKKFIEFIESGKLKIKAYPSKNLHAKVYIFLKKEGSEDFGKVITGSSNLTQSGLEWNLEFNVELKDAPDVELAENKFEELWKSSVAIPIGDDVTASIKTKILNNVAPYEIYIKTLYEYFKDRVDYDKNMIQVPPQFKKFDLQTEAVKDLEYKISTFGGAFLSDVVGLGKTYIASMLSKDLDLIPLVVCPPRLIKYWKEVMRQFGVLADVYSSDNLHNIPKSLNYDLVIVDEAHDFRNSETEKYDHLHEVCAGKKVLLVSATPFNNKPEDIASQIYLFQRKYKSDIPGTENISQFFNSLQKEYEDSRSKYRKGEISEKEYERKIEEISDSIRKKILNYIMLRRTRGDVKKFYKVDIEKHGLIFPEPEEPRNVFYKMDANYDKLFEETVKVIENGLTYAVYNPIKNLKVEGIDYLWEQGVLEKRDEETIKSRERFDESYTGFMKTILLKRLDSSIESFRKSIQNLIDKFGKYIEMYDKGTVFLTKNMNLIDDFLSSENIEDVIQKYFKHDEKDKTPIKSKYFKLKFREDIEKDLNMLKDLKSKWDKIKNDPKVEELIYQLRNDEILSKEKVIIFSEFADTVEYLEKKIKAINPGLAKECIFATGQSQSAVINEVMKNFDPEYEDLNKENKYRVLITTDVLSEGYNLNRATVVVNYEIPWNPTRVIQRFGRVDRIGSSSKIYLYNFFPAQKTENEINLLSTAKAKITLFIKSLGADSKYITTYDPSNAEGIWNNMKDIKNYIGKEEINEEFPFLQEIRDVRDNNPTLFKKIKEEIPAKARAIRNSDKNQLITYFKNGLLSVFYLANEHGAKKIDDAVEALKTIKAESDESTGRFSDLYWNLYDKNRNSFELETSKSNNYDDTLKRGINENKLLNVVKSIINKSNLLFMKDNSEISTTYLNYLEGLKKALQTGAFNNKARINSAVSKYENALKEAKKSGQISVAGLIEVILEVIPKSYVERCIEKYEIEKKQEVILSEMFIEDGGKNE